MLVDRDTFERRVEEVTRDVADRRAGLFGPSSVTWRVARENVVFFGAGRAALLQLAHPYVAHAIQQHSKTQTDPIGRFNRTFMNVFGMIFGDLDAALASAQRVRRVHDHIEGTIEERAGRFDKGHVYHANESEALYWVFATLMETAVIAYEIGVGPLSLRDKDVMYIEMLRFAGLFGVPSAGVPSDWSSFLGYVARMFASDQLAVTATAKKTATFLLSAPRPAMRPVMGVYRVVTAGLLPPRLRAEYGFDWGLREAKTFEETKALLARTWPRLPGRLRFSPYYVEALSRLSGRPAPDRVGHSLEQMMLWAVRPQVAGQGLIARALKTVL